MHKEVVRLQIEGDSYRNYISGEHKHLFVEDAEMQRMADELRGARHSMKSDNMLKKKIDDLEADIQSINPLLYTNADNLKHPSEHETDL